MKLNQVLTLVVTLFFIIFICSIIHTQINITYAQVFRVAEINNDLIYLVDYNGNEWIWEGVENWQVGDFAAAIMNTNGTAYIYDDIIMSLTNVRIAAR